MKGSTPKQCGFGRLDWNAYKRTKRTDGEIKPADANGNKKCYCIKELEKMVKSIQSTLDYGILSKYYEQWKKL